MASSLEFVNFIGEQIESCGIVSCKKMFGEYMVYVNAKPIILVCDDTAFVKINEVSNHIIPNNDIGEPYGGAKPHFILDVDDKELLCEVVAELEKITSLPKLKKKKYNMK